MTVKMIAFTGCAVLALMGTAAYASTSTSDGAPTQKITHHHHVAHYRAPTKTLTDAPQDQMLPAATPDPEPEYFNHAKGIDGSN